MPSSCRTVCCALDTATCRASRNCWSQVRSIAWTSTCGPRPIDSRRVTGYASICSADFPCFDRNTIPGRSRDRLLWHCGRSITMRRIYYNGCRQYRAEVSPCPREIPWRRRCSLTGQRRIPAEVVTKRNRPQPEACLPESICSGGGQRLSSSPVASRGRGRARSEMHT